MVESPTGTLLRYKGHEIAVREQTFFGGEEGGFDTPLRPWVETLYRSRDGSTRLFLVRDTWRGRLGDSHRRRHRYRVRRISSLGALLWVLGHTSIDPKMIDPLARKIARSFWRSIHQPITATAKGGAL